MFLILQYNIHFKFNIYYKKNKIKIEKFYYIFYILFYIITSFIFKVLFNFEK